MGGESMISKNITSVMQNSIIRTALVTAGILMIPLVFSWPWTLSDFVVMGTMIFVTCVMLNLVIKKAGKYRVYASIAIVLLFLWLWAELAVGLFTNWGS
jgi:hypothetical protein